MQYEYSKWDKKGEATIGTQMNKAKTKMYVNGREDGKDWSPIERETTHARSMRLYSNNVQQPFNIQYNCQLSINDQQLHAQMSLSHTPRNG